MKPEHAQNLATLADWLDQHAVEIELDDERASNLDVEGRFHMGWYLMGEGCGTSGCAIGWATVAVEPRKLVRTPTLKDHPLEHDYESWVTYANRLFGTHDGYPNEGQFMFGYQWINWPEMNTPKEAARRIRAVLANKGKAPAEWDHWFKGEFIYDPKEVD